MCLTIISELARKKTWDSVINIVKALPWPVRMDPQNKGVDLYSLMCSKICASTEQILKNRYLLLTVFYTVRFEAAVG